MKMSRIYQAEQKDARRIHSLMVQVHSQMENPSMYVCDDLEFVRRHIEDEGFILIAATLALRHSSARVWSKWMSATSGIIVRSESRFNERALSISGTAKRTISQPMILSSFNCFRIESNFVVFVSRSVIPSFHIVWTEFRCYHEDGQFCRW